MNKAPSLFSKVNLVPWLIIFAGLLMAFAKPVYSKLSPAELEIQIMQAPVVMPSIYKVYANDEALEGKYSLFKMIIKNTSGHAAENVEIVYNISNYVDNKVCQKINKILPGQTIVVNCYPNFPEKIVEKTTSSKEEVTVMVKGPNIKNVENNFSIQFKGRNEFVYSFIPADERRTAADMFDNKDLLSCLITPEDPIIKYLTQKIQEKVLKGEKAAVENNENEGVRFMLGVYEATLRSHMVYSGTTGVPEKVGDVSTMTQSIRLPREVITGKTGLCIELSLLYASIMMTAGMDPVVYLVPGHAYPGFRMNGNYYAIESTGIGGEGMGGRASGEDALKSGMQSLQKFMQQARMGDPGYMILDVREAIKKGAVAMELKDDNFLRQKIDEIAQSFEANAVPQNVNTNMAVTPQNGGGGNEGGNGGGGNEGGNGGGGNNNGGGGGNVNVPSGYTSYNGVVNFAYPASWRKQPRNEYTPPQLVVTFANSKNTYDVEVYNFPGYSSTNQAMNALQQHVQNAGANLGLRLQYENRGQSGNYTVYRGITGNQNVTVNWAGAFKSTGNGVVGITVGVFAPANGEETIMKILNTLQ